MNLILWRRRLFSLIPYPTYYIQIQKLRITKTNEMPHPFIFIYRGFELTGNGGLAKIFAQEPSIKPEALDENITSSSIS
jgi:hypothetical protein